MKIQFPFNNSRYNNKFYYVSDFNGLQLSLNYLYNQPTKWYSPISSVVEWSSAQWFPYGTHQGSLSKRLASLIRNGASKRITNVERPWNDSMRRGKSGRIIKWRFPFTWLSSFHRTNCNDTRSTRVTLFLETFMSTSKSHKMRL